MSDPSTPDLSSLLSQVSQLLSRQTAVIGANSDFLAGKDNDPASFNATGGTTGDLGYYPMTLPDGTVIYYPCLARLQDTAAAGPGGAQSLAARLAGAGGSALLDGTGASARAQAVTLQDKLAGNLELWDWLTLAMRADAIGGGLSVDISPAISAMMKDVPGGRVFVRRHKYRVSQTIQFKQRFHLYGDGGGQGYTDSAHLVFDAGVSGVIIHAVNTINGGRDLNNSGSGVGTILEGLWLQGQGTTADAMGGHGVWMRGAGIVRNCRVETFSGNNVNIVAGTGDPDATLGNANGWRVEGGILHDARGHGLYTSGSDANAGLCINTDVEGAGGWCFFDNSFLGNGYVATECAGGTLGAYNMPGGSQCNVLTGCYSEGGQPPSVINSPNLILGGLHGAGVKGNTGILASNQGVTSVIYHSDTAGSLPAALGVTDGTTGLGVRMTCDPNAKGLWLELQDGGQAHTYSMESSGGDIAWTRDHGAAGLAMEWTRTNTSNPIGPDKINLPSGYGFAGQKRLPGSAAPTSGAWRTGDRVENTSPSAGGYAGWVCVADGSPGTWKGYGKIDA